MKWIPLHSSLVHIIPEYRDFRVREVEIYKEASLHNPEARMLNSWHPGVGWGHNRGNHFYIILLSYREKFKIVFKQEPFSQKSSDLYEIEYCSLFLSFYGNVLI
jgi:hypothetical protein